MSHAFSMFKTLDDGSLDVTKKKPGQLRETSLQVARHLLADRIPYTVVNIIHSTDVSSLLCRDSIVDYKGHEVAQQPQPRNSLRGKLTLI